jgi:hypothetical protein
MGGSRCLPGMKRLTLLAAAAVLAVSVWILVRPRPTTAADRVEPPASPASRAAAGGPDPRVAPAPLGHVTRLADPEERRALASRIESRHSARLVHAAAPPSLPSLPAEVLHADDTDGLRTHLKAAMHEVIPFVTACYERALPTLARPDVTIAAHLQLTGDRDVGTLIDAAALVDDAGQPLPAAFDDCLRTTFQSLALPPLAEGDEVSVTYPFVFRSAN